MFKRPPDFVIKQQSVPYLMRWWVIPRNRYFNIYLHKFLRSDDDRAMHDHPWFSISIILKGGYMEHTLKGVFDRKPLRMYWRKATDCHRIELYKRMTICMNATNTGIVHELVPINQIAWTLFITGPKMREWGFHCPKGFRNWREFCGVPEGQEAHGDEKGPGCE